MPPTKSKNPNNDIEILKKIPIKTMIDTSEIFYYENGCYNKYGRQFLEKLICDLKSKKISIHKIREIIEKIKINTYVNRLEFNSDLLKINLRNGIYDIEERKLIPHDPKYLFLTQLPLEYDSDATCPTIDKFFHEVLNEKDIPAIYEFFGFCLYRKNFLEKFFLLHGAGSNGKSTLLALLRNFLGVVNCSAVPIQDLVETRFAVADLYGKLANICADIPSTGLQTTGMIKTLTGSDDLLRAEFKGQNSFQFINFSKLIFSCNQIPTAWDDTDAFYKRIRIIEFSQRFFGKENLNLGNELKKELSGLFNKSIEGLERLLKNGRFTNDPSLQESKNVFLRMSNSVYAFTIDMLEPYPQGVIGKQFLLQQYQKYCLENKRIIMSDKKFFQNIPKIFNVGTIYSGSDGNREYDYIGIQFKITPTEIKTINNTEGWEILQYPQLFWLPEDLN